MVYARWPSRGCMVGTLICFYYKVTVSLIKKDFIGGLNFEKENYNSRFNNYIHNITYTTKIGY